MNARKCSLLWKADITSAMKSIKKLDIGSNLDHQPVLDPFKFVSTNAFCLFTRFMFK